MAEGARLESVYTATYRGFESPPHRHILRRARTKVRAFFLHVAPTGGMRTPDRGSTTGFDITQYGQSQTLLHTINNAAKMFANTIPSSALSHPV